MSGKKLTCIKHALDLIQVKHSEHKARPFDASQSHAASPPLFSSAGKNFAMTSRRTNQKPFAVTTPNRIMLSSTPAIERGEQSERTLSTDGSLTRRALGLAIGSLLLAGCFSLLLMVGRMPVFSEWVSDPLFFKRCLVLHVDLALIVWFFAFAAGLFSLLPEDRSSHATFRLGFGVSFTGVLAMIGGTMIPRTAPVLANYVPVIDNPVYVAGVALFFGGLLLCFVNERLFVRVMEVSEHAPASVWQPFRVTPDVAVALKTAALAYVVAMTTFLVSIASTPRTLDAKSYYELVFWGGGHVLQVANVAAMLAVWLLLLGSLLKSAVLSPRTARVLFALLLAPHLMGPLLTLNGTITSTYRLGFTRLMQFGIAPVVVIILAICLRRLRQAWRRGAIGKADWRNPRLAGFAASAALTMTGFLMGSAIRNSNTMIPAHYHASIGAVTVAFMAVSYLLLDPLGFALPGARMARLIPWQLHLFGFGQVIFAIGFGLGGMHGLSRKAYGAEQHIRSVGELIGLGVMGAGGLIAVAGGLLFLLLMVQAAHLRLSLQFSKPKLQPLARSHA
jgi:cytochrome c oxidase subunit 1